jgi:hypothetical protein
VRTRVRPNPMDPKGFSCPIRVEQRPGPGKPKDKDIDGGLWYSWKPSASQRGLEFTSDVNHGMIADKLRSATSDVGGPFEHVQYGLRIDPEIHTMASRWDQYLQNNPREQRFIIQCPVLAVDPTTMTVDRTSPLRINNLGPKGTAAIAACKPTNHVSNLANDLVEIYHGQLPKLPGRTLWQQRTHLANSVGHEYLNKEFGWEPLVSDMRDASYAAANSARLVNAYVESSGKEVRRFHAFPPSETVSAVDLGPNDGYVGGNLNAIAPGIIDSTKAIPHLLKQTKTLTEYWFSGCFTYFIPPVHKHKKYGLSWIAEEAAHLYGVELTPDVVWQIAPWSWAVDWFSNTGQIISILSDMATDGLVLKYGYIMEHVFQETTYSLDRPSRWRNSAGGYIPATPVSTYYESKRRQAATPFGFEISWSNLSPRQLAITAALGLVRLL